MSSCPTRDIHSVYLDNEMPESIKTKYESHLLTCPQCQKTLAEIRKLRNFFAEDSSALNLEKTDLDESFARLQVKMSYSKHLAVHEKKPKATYKFMIPVAAAAAAVFAFVIPLRIVVNSPSVLDTPALASVVSKVPTASAVSLSSGSGKVISGNISRGVLYSSAQNTVAASTVGYDSAEKELIREVDVFRPTFEDRAYFKIPVPDMKVMYSYGSRPAGQN